MATGAWKWFYEGEPPAAGWYGVVLCWDPEEGQFPNSAYWDGSEWKRYGHAVIGYSPQAFPDKETAKAWADEHDPEGWGT